MTITMVTSCASWSIVSSMTRVEVGSSARSAPVERRARRRRGQTSSRSPAMGIVVKDVLSSRIVLMLTRVLSGNRSTGRPWSGERRPNNIGPVGADLAGPRRVATMFDAARTLALPGRSSGT